VESDGKGWTGEAKAGKGKGREEREKRRLHIGG